MSKFFAIIKNGVRFKNNKLPASYPKLKGNFSKNVETVGTACQKSGGYTKGRLFLNSDGNLYRTTSSVTSGETLVDGTNCEPFDVDGAYTELNADITNIKKIKSAQITADIPTSGIVNLRTDGKPVIYVTTAIQGWYYVIGTTGQTIWTKVFNYDGTVISGRTGIIFYYYYLDS